MKNKNGPCEAFERVLEKNALVQAVADRYAATFPSTEALNAYLKKHPNADARKHKVERPQDRSEEDKSLDDLKSRARHNKSKEKNEDPRAHSKKLINKAQKAKAGKPAYNAWKDVARHLREKGDYEGANHADGEASVHAVHKNKK